MIKSAVKFTVLGLLALSVTGTPIVLHAQGNDINSVTMTNRPPVNRAGRPMPFHGKVKALDHTAMTITVANTTFQVTSQTRITKDGKPATFGDGAVGDNVSASLKKDSAGKWTAVSVNFGVTAPKASGASNTRTNMP